MAATPTVPAVRVGLTLRIISDAPAAPVVPVAPMIPAVPVVPTIPIPSVIPVVSTIPTAPVIPITSITTGVQAIDFMIRSMPTVAHSEIFISCHNKSYVLFLLNGDQNNEGKVRGIRVTNLTICNKKRPNTLTASHLDRCENGVLTTCISKDFKYGLVFVMSEPYKKSSSATVGSTQSLLSRILRQYDSFYFELANILPQAPLIGDDSFQDIHNASQSHQISGITENNVLEIVKSSPNISYSERDLYNSKLDVFFRFTGDDETLVRGVQAKTLSVVTKNSFQMASLQKYENGTVIVGLSLDKLWGMTWDPLESTCRHASLSIL